MTTCFPAPVWRRLLRRACPLFLRLVGFRSFCAAVALASVPLTAAGSDWLKLEAPDFVAFGDASEKDLGDVALRYAAYREVFRSLFVPSGRTMPPSILLVYRRPAEFREAIAGALGVKGTTTMFCATEIADTPILCFALGASREETLASTVEFETVRALAHVGYSLPVWMSQGTGEVLSTFTLREGRCLVGLSGRDFDLKNFNSTQIPWPRFFEINEGSPEYSGRRANGNFHLQAWALMHWVLLDSATSRERFGELAHRLHTAPGLAAVEAVTQTSAHDFRSAIFHHLENFRAREFPVDTAAVRAMFKVSPAVEAEVLSHLADLLAEIENVPGANRQLDRAWHVAPNHPAVLVALARRAAREDRTEDATRLYRQAIRAGSTDLSAFLKSAEAFLDESAIGGRDAPGGAGTNAAQAVNDLHRALLLSPGNPEVYRLLGRAYYVAPTVAVAQADELDPGVATGTAGAQVRFYRGAVSVRAGRFAPGLADLRQVLADPDTIDPLREQAQACLGDALVAAAAAKIEPLVQDGKFDEARQVLLALDPHDLPPESLRKFDALKKHLEELAQ